jgi:hypothetical protein
LAVTKELPSVPAKSWQHILLALPIGDERDPGELADLALETMALEPRRGR